MTDTLERLFAEMEDDRSLDQPEQVRQRLEALDWLDACFPEFGLGSDIARLGQIDRRAKALHEKLEERNRELYRTMRGEIQRGVGSRKLLELCACPDLGAGAVSAEGYDFVDEVVAGVLQLERPEPLVKLEAEMVNYQPTPARHIFDMLQRVALNERDVLVDLGCGLGHVPLLTAICTPARGIGVELEPAFVESARRSAGALNLTNATFLNEDARAVDFSAGTLFYLYTPFGGSILRGVLDALRIEAAQRAIRICTFGPCTEIVAGEPWLQAEDTWAPDRIAMFCSRG